MTKEKAISYLGMAVPLTALTVERFAEFDEAIRMAAQALEAEPKTGKWIPCDVDSRRMTNMFVCSKCGSFTSLPILKYANAMEYDYCPHCGSYNGDDEE